MDKPAIDNDDPNGPVVHYFDEPTRRRVLSKRTAVKAVVEPAVVDTPKPTKKTARSSARK